MPLRNELKKVTIIGSGPIIIGQAAEFDYSGSQACKAVREEGIKVVLVNSNPATIQTDRAIADIVYLEPLTAEFVEKIIAIEKPDGILSGMGGQTALNICSELAERGILERYGIQLLGSSEYAIAVSEDRNKFKSVMQEIGEPIPRSLAVNSLAEAVNFAENVGYPVIIRPAYTLGGTGSGVAYNRKELEEIVSKGLLYSRIQQVLVEECVLNWGEFEYEVMRDSNDNCIAVCNMENIDPMGIHTGESIVVAPAQTLSDRDNQMLRSAALKIIRALKIEGGCNIQFALNQKTGKYYVIEVNPRVSRSSALASKATGYPIAKIAAKIAIGMTLDEIKNPITGNTYACFEPTVDYVVTKIPRWPFDKFRTIDTRIGTQMKSTGEVMAIGRNIEESLQKAIRSLEIKKFGLSHETLTNDETIKELKTPTHKRIFYIAEALRRKMNVKKISELTGYNKFFIQKIKNIVECEENLKNSFSLRALLKAKKLGCSDKYIAEIIGTNEDYVRSLRTSNKILPDYKIVDTCAGEFDAKTPYYYSTYELGNANKALCKAPLNENDVDNKKVAIIGSGAIRIGQGIEFDYCSVHAAFALKENGIETIMINNNPETVSTDFDTSTRLYFEPLTFEDAMNVIEHEKPFGIIVQLGGQTSINLGMPIYNELKKRNLKTKILGTSPEAIDIAEDRELFEKLMKELEILRPPASTGYSFEEVKRLAYEIGYPVLIRPSYVLGGRAMEIVYNEEELREYMEAAVEVSEGHPVLIDKFLTNAIEVDVDAICDGKDVFIGGILEHIEEAGVHSGDASMVMPPQNLSSAILKNIKNDTKKIALALNTVGLINIQFAVQNGNVYVIEANPRASRTIPFVSKAIGIPMVKVATEVILGKSLKDALALYHIIDNDGVLEKNSSFVAVKASVFPFSKLQGVDCILGPEMKSTGEVMGIGKNFYEAYYKAMLGAGNPLPLSGNVFISVRDEDKTLDRILPIAKILSKLKFTILATEGTAKYLELHDIRVKTVHKIHEQAYPDAISLMKSGKIDLIINTSPCEPDKYIPSRKNGYLMRRVAVELQIPYIPNISAAKAAVEALKILKNQKLDVTPL